MKLSRFYIDDDFIHHKIMFTNSLRIIIKSIIFKWKYIRIFRIDYIHSNNFSDRNLRLLEYIYLHKGLPRIYIYYAATKPRPKNYLNGITDSISQFRIFYPESIRCRELNSSYLIAHIMNSIRAWILNYSTFEQLSCKGAIESFFLGRNLFINRDSEMLVKLYTNTMYKLDFVYNLVSFYNNIWGIVGFWAYMRYEWLLHVFLFSQVRDRTEPRRVNCLRAYYFYHVVRTQSARDIISFFFKRYYFENWIYKLSYFHDYSVMNSFNPYYYHRFIPTAYSDFMFLRRFRSRTTSMLRDVRSFSISDNIVYDCHNKFVHVNPMLTFMEEVSYIGSHMVIGKYLGYGLIRNLYGYIYNYLLYNQVEDKFFIHLLLLRNKYVHYMIKLVCTGGILDYRRKDLFYTHINLFSNKSIYYVWKFYILFDGIDLRATRNWPGFSLERKLESIRKVFHTQVVKNRLSWLFCVKKLDFSYEYVYYALESVSEHIIIICFYNHYMNFWDWAYFYGCYKFVVSDDHIFVMFNDFEDDDYDNIVLCINDKIIHPFIHKYSLYRKGNGWPLIYENYEYEFGLFEYSNSNDWLINDITDNFLIDCIMVWE